MRCSVFCAVTLDGFIARKDGSLDWLKTAEATLPPSETGYDAFMAAVDQVVMGRNTFDTILGMSDQWLYSKPVYVLTSRPLPLAPSLKEKNVESGLQTPAELVVLMEGRGRESLYVDGGKTIQDFLRAGLINDMIITQIPILIGEGIPLFGPIPEDVNLRTVSSRLLRGGAVQTTYRVER